MVTATVTSTDTVTEGYAQWCPSMDGHGWSRLLWHPWTLWQRCMHSGVHPWMVMDGYGYCDIHEHCDRGLCTVVSIHVLGLQRILCYTCCIAIHWHISNLKGRSECMKEVIAHSSLLVANKQVMLILITTLRTCRMYWLELWPSVLWYIGTSRPPMGGSWHGRYLAYPETDASNPDYTTVFKSD